MLGQGLCEKSGLRVAGMEKAYSAGVDIGSTTAKVVICDDGGKPVFTRYRRHQARTGETTREIFEEALRALGDVELDLTVTGSAGMGTAEAFGLPFVQEVVASAHLIKRSYPEVRTYQRKILPLQCFTPWPTCW